MAISEFPLAYDRRHAFEMTFHNVFPSAEPPFCTAFKNDQDLFGSIADLIVFVHLNHSPIIEPQCLRNVLDHLVAMAQLSRDSWKRILAETDDHNE
jgi:hypothetical protein